MIPDEGFNIFQLLTLAALQGRTAGGRTRQAKHVYAGTVPHSVIAERRRKNKAARVARRANR